jgi:hypothetical protein
LDASVAAEHECGLDHGVGFCKPLVGIAGGVHALEGEIVAKLGMDHWRAGVERGLGVGDGGERLVVDRHRLAGVLGFGARARHHGTDRFALPACALDGDRMLRRRLDALQVREHADPGGDHLGQLRAGDDGDDARRLPGVIGIDALDLRMRVRRTRERNMRHARQRHIADELCAPLCQPRQIRARHRAADIGIGPVQRSEDGRGVIGNFHGRAPARCCATASIASTMA